MVPRPAATHAGEGVRSGLRGGHGVTFKGILAPLCTVRKPKLWSRSSVAALMQKHGRTLSSALLPHPPPRLVLSSASNSPRVGGFTEPAPSRLVGDNHTG